MPPDALASAVADAIAEFRTTWHPDDPLDPFVAAQAEPELIPWLREPLVIEAFWLCCTYGRRFLSVLRGLPVTVEAFLARYPGLEPELELMRKLLAVELHVAGNLPQREDLERRFPGNRDLWEAFLEDHAIIARTALAARAPGRLPSIIAETSQSQAASQARHTEWARGQRISSPEVVELDRPAGEGAFKLVLAARQESTERIVAAKIPKTSQAESWRGIVREGKLVASLQHQHIPPVFGIQVMDSGEPVLTERLIEGEEWKQRLENENKQLLAEPSAEARAKLQAERVAENLVILRKVCSALIYVHTQRRLAHLDVKPANVRLSGRDEVFLLDWGAAVQVGEQADPELLAPHRSDPRLLLQWTAWYAPPELLSGERERLCPASDVFMLGAILYQILTGEGPVEVPHAQTAEPEPAVRFARPAGLVVPDELWAIVEQATALDIASRYPDALAFDEALVAYLKVADAEQRFALTREKFAEARAVPTAQRTQAVAATLLEVIDECRIAAEAWDRLPAREGGHPGQQRVRAVQFEAHGELARLYQQLGEYGSSEAQWERAAQLGNDQALACERAAKAVRRLARRRWLLQFSGVAFPVIAVAMVGYGLWLQLQFERQQNEAKLAERAKQLAIAGKRSLTSKQQAYAAAQFAASIAAKDTPAGRAGWSEAVALGLANNLQATASCYRIRPGRMAWLADGQHFVLAEPDGLGRLMVWTRGGELVQTFDGHPEPTESGPRPELTCVRGLAVDPAEPRHFYSCGLDQRLRLTMLAATATDPTETKLSAYHGSALTALDVARPAKAAQPLIITGDDAGSLTAWHEVALTAEQREQGELELQPLWTKPLVSERIVVLDLAANGHHLAFITPKGPVRLCSAQGELLAELALPDEATILAGLAFSPDGSYLAGGATDGSVAVWRVADRALVSRLAVHGVGGDGSTETRQVAWRGQDELVSVGADGVLARWKPFAQEPVKKSAAVPAAIYGQTTQFFLALSPDGQVAVTGDAAKLIRLWDVASLSVSQQSEGAMIGAVSAIGHAQLHPGRNLLATGGLDAHAPLRLLDAQSLRVLAAIRDGMPAYDEQQPLGTAVALLSWSANGQHLAVAFANGDLAVYDVPEKPSDIRLVWRRAAPHGEATQLASLIVPPITLLSWAGEVLVTAGRDHFIRQWQSDGQAYAEALPWKLPARDSSTLFEARSQTQTALMQDMLVGQAEPNGQYLIVNGTDERLLRLALEPGAEPQLIANGHRARLTDMQLSADGHRLITSSADGMVIVWDWLKPDASLVALPLAYRQLPPANGRSTTSGNPLEDSQRAAVTQVRLSSDAAFAAMVQGDGSVTVADAITLSPLHVVQAPLSSSSPLGLVAIPFFTEAGELLTASASGEVVKWELNPFAREFTLPRPEEAQLQEARELAFNAASGYWLGRFRRYGTLYLEKAGPDGLPALKDFGPQGMGKSFQQDFGASGLAAVASVPGKPLAVLAGHNGVGLVYDLAQSRVVARFTPPAKAEQAATFDGLALAIDPKGETVAQGSKAEDVLHFWSLSDGKLLRSVKLPEKPEQAAGLGMFDKLKFGSKRRYSNTALAAAWHPSEPRVAVVQEDDRLTMIDTTAGRVLYTTEPGPNLSSSQQLTFSSDGSHIIHVGKIPGHIHIWAATSGRLLERLESHLGMPQTMDSVSSSVPLVSEVECVRLLPPSLGLGQGFVTSGSDGCLRYCTRNASGRYELRLVISPIDSQARFAKRESLDLGLGSPMNESLMSQSISSLAFSPDGKALLLANSDGLQRINQQRALELMRPSQEEIVEQTKRLTGLELDTNGELKQVQRLLLHPPAR